MTSMPASRKARAMTFAPRSCPSSPGLAMITRIFRVTGPPAFLVRLSASDDGHFLVFAPDLTQRVAHLAEGGVRAHGVQNRRHQVLGPSCRSDQRIERAPHAIGVAPLLQPLQSGELPVRRGVIDIEDPDGRVV